MEAHVYPNLYDRFRTEGVCPVCLMEIDQVPRYTCGNSHMICCRCKPYYYACPTCRSPFGEELPPPQVAPHLPPPPTHFMPHPLPPQYHNPSAPPAPEDFLQHERAQIWMPPVPSAEQSLRPCAFAYLGCWVQLPEHLQELHESRCQFGPHASEGQVPGDQASGDGSLTLCRFHVVGCRVRTVAWRAATHESKCQYREKYEAMSGLADGLTSVTISDEDGASAGFADENELVECRYRKYGCRVNVPRRRKFVHEAKCNYSKCRREEDDYVYDAVAMPQPVVDGDPDEQLPCTWERYGCRVKPKRCRLAAHQEKCNYRMEECAYGCGSLFAPSRRYAHERSCEFAN